MYVDFSFLGLLQESFTGKDFVDWVVDKKRVSREKAIFMGKQLVSRRFGLNVDEEQEFKVRTTSMTKRN